MLSTRGHRGEVRRRRRARGVRGARRCARMTPCARCAPPIPTARQCECCRTSSAHRRGAARHPHRRQHWFGRSPGCAGRWLVRDRRRRQRRRPTGAGRAPGEILLGEETYALVRDAVRWPRLSIRWSPRARPAGAGVPSLPGRTAPPGRHGPRTAVLLGRDRETRALEMRFARTVEIGVATASPSSAPRPRKDAARDRVRRPIGDRARWSGPLRLLRARDHLLARRPGTARRRRPRGGEPRRWCTTRC